MKIVGKILFLTLLFSLIFSFAVVSASENLTFEQSVSNNISIDSESTNPSDNMLEGHNRVSSCVEDSLLMEDSDNHCLKSDIHISGNTFNDIQTAINNANAGDIIFLNGNTYYGSGNEISISKQITLVGGSSLNDNNLAKLDAKSLSRIFIITGGKVVISGISFINGYHKTYSGAIEWNGNDGFLSNSYFGNNTGDTYNGAIRWNGINGKLLDCTFENNTSGFGSIAGGSGGAVDWNGANGLLANCRLINNRASSLAGALKWDGNNGTLSNCTFENNAAGESGGAVYWSGNDGRMSNCSYLNTTVLYLNSSPGGGAMVWWADRGILSNCTFINSIGRTIGAVYWRVNNGIINNCTFINNTATVNYGALGIYYYSNTISNCIFINNTAGSDGGAIALSQNNVVYNCTFINNTAKTNGGAIIGGGLNNRIFNCTFINNTAKQGGGVNLAGKTNSLYDCIFINNTARSEGGGIYSSAADSNLWNCSFTGNTANTGGGIYWKGTNAKFFNSTFKHNSANTGGGIYSNSDGKNLTIANCGFEYNLGKTNGGAISFYTPNGFVSNCTFINNSARTNNAGSGGAVYWNTGNGILTNCSFRNNSAYEAGAIYLNGNAGKVNNCTFVNNFANSAGAILWRYGNGLLTNSSFINNSALSNGGAVNWFGATGTVNNCTFINNTNKDNGGAIYWGNVNAVVTNSGFFNNSAKYGGAIYFASSNPSIFNSRFYNNIAKTGSALYYSFSGSNKIQDSVFLNNRADSTSLTINSNTVERNAFIKVTLSGEDNILNAIYSRTNTVSIKNVTYYSHEGVMTSSNEFVNPVNSADLSNGGKLYYKDNREAGQNITLEVYDSNGNLLVNYTDSSDIYGAIYLNLTKLNKGTYTVKAYFDENDYYTKISRESSFNINPIHNPKFEITKLSLSSNVMVGSIATFEIIINNTGDIALNDIIVIEEAYDGLTYVDYHKSPLWNHYTVDGKHAWKLVSPLAVREIVSLFVDFNTTTNGTFINNVVANSTTADNKMANATVTALYPQLNIHKYSLIPVTTVGNQTIFEITIINNGALDVHNLFIIEDSYDGLVYDHYIKDDLWSHSIVNGKNKWVLKDKLVVNENVGLLVVFNTTQTGNFTNYAIVGCDEISDRTVNATVRVNETVIEEELNPDLEITLSTMTPLVILGDPVIFEVTVHNIGDAVLHNVTVQEESYNGLIYDKFIDYTGMWEEKSAPTQGLLSASNPLSWMMNMPLYINETVSFFLRFNSTAVGTFINTVSATSDKTSIRFAEDDVEVVTTQFTVEKVSLNKTVTVGDEVAFEIIIQNTGTVTISDLTIIENPDDGLTYKSYIDEESFWDYEGNLRWSLKKDIVPGEVVELFITFKTDKVGNLTNSITCNDVPANSSVVDVSEIKNPILEVNSTDDVVYIGENAIITITVMNKGNVDLENVFVKIDFNDTLKFLNISSDDDWSIIDSIFMLNNVLKVNQSSSFNVILGTTQVGNFTNVVYAGFDDENSVNTTSIVEVLQNKTPTNDTPSNNTPADNTPVNNNSNNKTEKQHQIKASKDKGNNKTVVTNEADEHIKNVEWSIKSHATGNPIFLLLFVFLNVIIFRKGKR